MDSLLNVIRAIIDMLPGRCKTINSSFTLWYLPSTPQSASRRQLWPYWSAQKKATRGPGVPRGVCVCHVNKDAGMLPVWRIAKGFYVFIHQACMILNSV